MAHRISNRGRSSRVTRPFRKNGRLGRWRALAFEPLESRVLLDAAGPLSGTVFEDLNHDGVMDIGEPGLPGFEVELERLGGHVRSSSFETYHGDVTSVAIQGDRYLVGVPGYRSKDSAVQLFDLHTGELLQTFRDPRPEIDAHFGLAVTFVGDNVLVSAPTTLVSDQPFAYLFDGVTGELLHTFVDPRADSRLSLASVGNHVLIGDAMDGSAYLFDATTGELVRTFSHPDNSVGEFGQSVAFVGDDVLVGARDRLYLFDGTTGEPLRVFANPAPSYNGFAHSLVVSGTQILVGTRAPWQRPEAERAAYLFDAGTGELLQTFTNPDDRSDVTFGESVTFLGDNVLVGAPGHGTSGSAYLFDAATGELLDTFHGLSPNGYEEYGFGRSIAADGDHFLVGSTGYGRDSVHLFTTSTSIPTSTITATTDAEGNYRFDQVEPGSYVVSAVLPAGYAQTLPDGDGTYTIVVGDAQGLSALDFGAVNSNPQPVPDPAPSPTFEFSGTVVFLTLEGGFYGIVGDDGGHYDPLALPAEFAQQGAQVRVVARARTDLASFHMWGTIIQLIDIQPGNPAAREEIPDVVDEPVPLPGSDLGLLPYYVAGWQFAGTVIAAPVVARALPEMWLYQGEGSTADRSDVASNSSLAPVDAFFTDFSDDFLPESEPDRALPVDAALHDWESETGWPLEFELEPGLSDFLLEMEPGESAAPLL